MNELINGLLELSRMAQVELRRENIDLTSLARQVMADLQRRVRDSNPLPRDCEGE